tara:strand:- start:588 stop:872 length:285 start_codon:yes stop_codon:yes gene_type:complete
MNDTDKYDYENIQQWVVSGNTVLSVAPPENRIVASNLTIQDAQLIADAPKLLAEVKRLRGIAKTCLEAIEAGGDIRSGTIELIEHNLKLMEMIK